MDDLPEPGTHPAGPPPSDEDRQAAVDRVQQALADDHITFEELDGRFAAIFEASTGAELERAVTDLPEPHHPTLPSQPRHLAPARRFALIGDTRIGGWLAFERESTVTVGIGDTTIDLSTADIGPDGATVTVRRLIGDVRVIVPDGARVRIDGGSLIGDNQDALSPPAATGPIIRVRTFGLIGDVGVYSLSLVPPGRLRQLWSALRRSAP